MDTVFVALAQKPTVTTTSTSLVSLAKNIGNYKGIIKKATLRNSYINLEIGNGENNETILVEQDSHNIHTSSFLNHSTNEVQKTLLEVVKRVQNNGQLALKQVSFDEGLKITFGEATAEVKHKKLRNSIEKEKKTNILLLLDGPNILNRAYYATSYNPERMMQAPDGRFINAVNGFLQMLNHYITQFRPTHIAICWDEGKSWRKLIYPDYKSGRKETPPELKSQFPIIRNILPQIGIPCFSNEEFEADDFIASLKTKFLRENPSGKVYIISNDQDLLQLVDTQTTVISRKNKDDVKYNPEQFRKDYFGFEPIQIIDLKAIEGDNSDNIKGIPGIGETGAIKLLTQYKTVETLLANKTSLDSSFNRYKKKILNDGDQATFCKKLATLTNNIERINSLELSKLTLNIDVNSLIDVCKELQLSRILKSIENRKWYN